MNSALFPASAFASPHSTAYAWLMLAGILVSLAFWCRLAASDSRLLTVYIAALGGAFIGAKIVYLSAEGWLYWSHANRWMIWATGKSITGGLLGGFAGVQIAKRCMGYRGTVGDWFAIIVPVSIALGRIGCVIQGCCLGRVYDERWFTVRDAQGFARWPAAQVELLFNLAALGIVVLLRRLKVFPSMHFYLYLAGYGIFRFLHEFLRDTPRTLGPLSGYQVAALAVTLLGLAGLWRRFRKLASPYTCSCS